MVVSDRATGAAVSGSLVLADTPVNDVQPITLDFQNTGSANTTVSPILFGSAFSLCCDASFTLQPAEVHSITLQFAPLSPGNYTGSIQFGSVTILLFARALAAASLYVQTPSGLVQAHSGAPLEVVMEGGFSGQLPCTLRNDSGQPLPVQSIAVGGSWSILNSASASPALAAGDSFAFTLVPAGGSSADNILGSVLIDQRSFEIDVHANIPKFHIQLSSASLNTGEQATLSMVFDHAPAVALQGSVELTLRTSFSVAVEDPAILFPSTGVATASFSSSPGQTSAAFAGQTSIAFQSGTTSGTLHVHASWGFSEDQQDIVLAPSPIKVDTVTATRASDALNVTVTGFDNTRSAGRLSFSFFDSKGSFIGNPVTADATEAFYNLFFATDENGGGMFTMTATFPVTGDPSVVGSVQVDLINTAGDQQSPVTTFQ